MFSLKILYTSWDRGILQDNRNQSLIAKLHENWEGQALEYSE